MKRITLLSLSLILLWLPNVKAEVATEAEMEMVCQNWLSVIVREKGHWAGVTNPQIVGSQEIIGSDNIVLGRYYSISPAGHIIVPVLKELPPIKAYSDKGTFNANESDGFPQLIREVLEHRADLYIKRYGSLDAQQPDQGEVLLGRKHREEWDRYAVPAKQFLSRLSSAEFGTMDEEEPLLTTAWHQRNPYNNFCPDGDLECESCSSSRSPTPTFPTKAGCAAVAVAQILNYYEWPPNGYDAREGDDIEWDGDDTCGDNVGGGPFVVEFTDPYDWANMPDSCPSGCTQVQRDAVAELVYEVGVALESDYGVCATTVFPSNLRDAYTDYFGYSGIITWAYRSDHTPISWFELIVQEIDAGRPIQYVIWAHLLVCDGWRTFGGQAQYHMNYGWTDANYDEWYLLDDLYCDWDGCDFMEERICYRIQPNMNLYEPTEIAAGSNVCEEVLITWEYTHTGHTGFKIFRTGAGPEEMIYQGDDPNLRAFIDYSAPDGGCEYTVASYRIYPADEVRSSASAYVEKLTVPVKPDYLDVTSAGCLDVLITWGASSQAEEYRIYRDSNVIDIVDHTVSECIEYNVPQGLHMYSIEAHNTCGISGLEYAAIDVEYGTIPPPALRDPDDGETDVSTSGHMDWDPVSGAIGYYLQIATSNKTACVYPVGGTGFSYSDLQPGETYQWRVFSADGCGYEGDPSAWFSFTTIPRNPSNGTVKIEQKISQLEGNFAGPLDSYDFFGRSIALLEDIDCDGVVDIAVGAHDDDGGNNRGAVWILCLNSDGTVKDPIKISDTESDFDGTLGNGDLFGYSIASVGDLNGDIFMMGEIAVGAPGDDDGGSRCGAVWIIFPQYGPTFPTSQKISASAGGFSGVLEEDDRFGYSVAPLGDLNGDGVRDIVVGAYGDDDGGADRGAVWVLFLNSDGTVSYTQKISDTEGSFDGVLDNYDNFGYSVASLGDINGDGVCDISVGAPGDDDGGVSRGAVWILFLENDGTVGSEQKISAVQGNLGSTLNDDDGFGFSVSSLKDLNDDGVFDLLVGAPGDDDGGEFRGAVWILFLTSDGTVDHSQKISSTQGNFRGTLDDWDLFGNSVASLGDLDGDGKCDIAVGACDDDDGGSSYGAVWILFLSDENTVALNTPVGQDVLLNTEQGLMLTFENVDQEGVTEFTFEETGPDFPDGFEPAIEPPTYHYITTNAGTSGDITICIDYDPLEIVVSEEHVILYHYDESLNPPEWVSIAAGGVGGTICGVTSSLSPFVLAVTETVDVSDGPSIHEIALHQNVPNPFNPTTTIRFDLPRAVQVRFCVYNVKGELVATLVDRQMTGGRKEVDWAAKDNRGKPVSSGIYFYRLIAGDFVQTRKMVLLR